MSTNCIYEINGANALVPRKRAQLRLVYDRRYDVERQPQTKPSSTPAVIFVSVCVALLIVVGTISAMARSNGYYERQSALSALPTETVTVMPGDSLWTLASRCDIATVETDDIVRWLKEHNELTTSNLSVGQRLEIPIGSR